MRLLIVEDDAALGMFLQKGFRLEGHVVQLVGDGNAAVEQALEYQPDLMVLDLSLPNKDGLEVLEELKGKLEATSILVLTGRSAIEDRVKCLDLGADDCLLKPFSYSELTARCRALLRRRDHCADATLRTGNIELNRIQHKVTRHGQPVDLTVKEFALLEYLMRARGRICSRSELLREVWQMTPDAGTNVVDVYVNYLRKKLSVQGNAEARIAGAMFDADRVIETVRGEGYSIPVTGPKRPVRSVSVEEVAMLHCAPGAWTSGRVASA